MLCKYDLYEHLNKLRYPQLPFDPYLTLIELSNLSSAKIPSNKEIKIRALS